MGEDTLALRLMLTAGLLVALGGAALSIALFLIFRAGRATHQHTGRAALPPWNGFAVVGAIAVFVVFNLTAAVIQSVLIQAGFFTRLYGADFPIELPADPSASQRGAATLRLLWSSALAFPFALAAMVLLRRYLGIRSTASLSTWPRGFVAGYLTWLVVTPAAFCIFVLASLIHFSLTGRGPEKHPLTVVGELAGPLEWGLFALQTVVIAPVIEEWMFRGVLLPWLAQKKPVAPETPWTIPPRARPMLILIGALGVGCAFTLGTEWLDRPGEVRHALADNLPRFVSGYLIPAVFFALLIPIDPILRYFGRVRRYLRIRSTQELRAIWASAAIFAAVHASVWPSPIPLLVLALGLGYLYLRTRSLAGPIVVHALFNAVSATYLMLGGRA